MTLVMLVTLVTLGTLVLVRVLVLVATNTYSPGVVVFWLVVSPRFHRYRSGV